jgi:predicted flap endonuclease-1-like 5' DNA nuclease
MFRRIGIMLTMALVSLTLCGFSAPVAGAEETGNPWWIWILVLLALVLFVAVVLWWWMRSSAEGEEEELAFEAIPSSVGTVEEAGTETQAPPAPDDLKRIEGIGPKISSVLQAAGIATFAQLAVADVDRLRHILERENPNLLRLADPTTWPQQAGLAAAGDWEALEALQGELKGGRRV